MKIGRAFLREDGKIELALKPAVSEKAIQRLVEDREFEPIFEAWYYEAWSLKPKKEEE